MSMLILFNSGTGVFGCWTAVEHPITSQVVNTGGGLLLLIGLAQGGLGVDTPIWQCVEDKVNVRDTWADWAPYRWSQINATSTSF